MLLLGNNYDLCLNNTKENRQNNDYFALPRNIQFKRVGISRRKSFVIVRFESGVAVIADIPLEYWILAA